MNDFDDLYYSYITAADRMQLISGLRENYFESVSNAMEWPRDMMNFSISDNQIFDERVRPLNVSFCDRATMFFDENSPRLVKMFYYQMFLSCNRDADEFKNKINGSATFRISDFEITNGDDVDIVDIYDQAFNAYKDHFNN